MQQLFKTIKGLWSLLVGLKITGVELCKPWITVHYPREQVDNISSFRGHIELVPAPEDPLLPRCIMCLKCAEACPSQCITVRAHIKGDGNGHSSHVEALMLAPEVESPYSIHRTPPPEKIERVLDAFGLNFGLCSLCGLCVQSCPVGAIRFSRNAYLIGTTRKHFELDLLARLKTPMRSTVSTRTDLNGADVLWKN
jgi:NADH-quinone oxidoreductase subunit I